MAKKDGGKGKHRGAEYQTLQVIGFTPTTKADGHGLALDMLDHMRDIGRNELCLDDAKEVREGRPQSEVMIHYLRMAQRNSAVLKGFLAVITDVLGEAVESETDYRDIVARAEDEARLAALTSTVKAGPVRRRRQRVGRAVRHG